jgi:O-methyltransferase involved in polyketide biosynthesis
MESKTKIEPGKIQMTLFMPVWARAVETRKSNPIITDPTAVEIIDSVDFDFTAMAANMKDINLLSWVARCKRYDMIINDFVKKYPGGSVVNIGCGLDTTYERAVEKPAHWYDLDLPDVIELRKKFIKESDNRRSLANSFLDYRWFDEIPVTEKTLIISAGVFVYFEEYEIRNFIEAVADKFLYSEMFFDVTSPKGLEIANKVIKKSGLDNNVVFKWALTDKSIFSSWDNSIKTINIFYTFLLPQLKLSFKNRIMGYLSDSAGVQYMVHLLIDNNKP